jgi:hypothetical protein
MKPSRPADNCKPLHLLDADDANERAEPLIARPRANIAKLKKMLSDRAG